METETLGRTKDASRHDGKPGISMVMTCYNRAPFIREAVLSCLMQDYEGDMELIIVDDCSTDDSPSIIQQVIQDTPSPIPARIIRTPRNLGVAGATDTGWKAARYPWICMVDGDDIQCPERCSRLAALIEAHPDAGMIEMSSINIDEANKPFGYTNYCFIPYEKAPEELYLADARTRADNYLWKAGEQRMNSYGCSMAINKKLFTQWGKLYDDKQERYAQDVPWEFRAMLSAPVLGSKQIATLYRTHRNNIQNRSWAWESWRGLADLETFYSRHSHFLLSSIRQMQRDLEKARTTPGLSDWPADAFEDAARHLEREANSCLLRCNWWFIPWPARVLRCLRYHHNIPPSFRRWGWVRLMPFRLFCYMKWRTKCQRKPTEPCGQPPVPPEIPASLAPLIKGNSLCACNRRQVQV